ncbi:hypothetical protein PM082_016005 [Marasmius tenuissimus]|nr:hypothetical protein PM082_016005 [Marasmius tenuissimus]
MSWLRREGVQYGLLLRSPASLTPDIPDETTVIEPYEFSSLVECWETNTTNSAWSSVYNIKCIIASCLRATSVPEPDDSFWKSKEEYEDDAILPPFFLPAWPVEGFEVQRTVTPDGFWAMRDLHSLSPLVLVWLEHQSGQHQMWMYLLVLMFVVSRLGGMNAAWESLRLMGVFVPKSGDVVVRVFTFDDSFVIKWAEQLFERNQAGGVRFYTNVVGHCSHLAAHHHEWDLLAFGQAIERITAEIDRGSCGRLNSDDEDLQDDLKRQWDGDSEGDRRRSFQRGENIQGGSREVLNTRSSSATPSIRSLEDEGLEMMKQRSAVRGHRGRVSDHLIMTV